MHIEEKEQAIDRHKVIKEQHRSKEGSLLIYINGSTHRGHVRAAAITGGRNKYRQLYMGLETQLTVYTVELQGIRMGFSLIVHNTRVRELFIFTDNQATIQAIYYP